MLHKLNLFLHAEAECFDVLLASGIVETPPYSSSLGPVVPHADAVLLRPRPVAVAVHARSLVPCSITF